MATEIELKYLVSKTPSLENIKNEKIIQGYLHRSHGPDETKSFIDLYVKDEKCIISISGKNVDFPQAKYEYEIPVKDFNEILQIINSETNKTRLNGTTLTIRIRLKGKKGLLTLKGERIGLSQPEYEYYIPDYEAKALFEICEPGILEKTRYYIPHDNHTIELDIFEGKNSGLILAEIELNNEAEKNSIKIPDWFDKDVSEDSNYANAALSR